MFDDTKNIALFSDQKSSKIVIQSGGSFSEVIGPIKTIPSGFEATYIYYKHCNY